MELAELEEKLKVFTDPRFVFEEKKHIYTYAGRILQSGTAVAKQFKVPFDLESKSLSTARRTGQTQAEVKRQWAHNGLVARTMGTDVHKHIEDRYTPGMTPPIFTDPETNVRIQLFEDVMAPRLASMIPVRQELRVFSLTKGVCGTIDALFLKDGKLYILDWKTNGSFRRDKDHAFEMLLFPFDAYKENEHNEYSIQLNLYKIILEEHGIPVEACAIVSIPPKIGKDEKPMQPEIYKCKNFAPLLESYFAEKLAVGQKEEV